jgi:hypothetical protein
MVNNRPLGEKSPNLVTLVARRFLVQQTQTGNFTDQVSEVEDSETVARGRFFKTDFRANGKSWRLCCADEPGATVA